MSLRKLTLPLSLSLVFCLGNLTLKAADDAEPEAPTTEAAAADSEAKDSAEKEPAAKEPVPEEPRVETEKTPAKEKQSEGEEAPDLAAAQAAFDKVVEEWKSGLKELVLLQEEYRKAGAARQAKMETDYDAKRKQLAEVVKPQLIEAAIRLYRLEGKDNQDLENFLRRVLLERFDVDDWRELHNLTHLLKDSGVDEPQLDLFDAIAAYGLNDFDHAQANINKAIEAGLLQPPQDPSKESSGMRRRRELGMVVRDTVEEYKDLWKEEKAFREAEAEADDLPRVKIETTQGDIVVELYENEAPNTVANFVSLVEKGYYDGILFHRVLPGFMAQTGDPNGDGSGGPGYRIPCECYKDVIRKHFTGSLSMAKTAQKDTGGSQFFLTFRPTPHLNGMHTVFGRVIEGMDVLSKLQRVDPQDRGQPAELDKILKASVIRKRDHAYVPQTLPGN